MKRKIISLILCLLLLSALCPVHAAAASGSRIVLGADLSEEQIAAVYAVFGVERGSVPELTVTNAEERKTLSGTVSESLIGNRSLSCVYIRQLGEGEGYSISVNNIDWCTEEMYRNALVTAGIEDVRVMVTAPFSVSGTAALTGIYKAYEDITGTDLNETAKQVGAQELVTTGELADEVGSAGATSIVNELKLILSETEGMSDEELASRIREIAAQYSVSLSDEQVQQLISLCRQLEKLDSAELTDRVRQLQDKLKGLGEWADKADEALNNLDGFREKAAAFFQTLGGYLQAILDFFKGLVNGE